MLNSVGVIAAHPDDEVLGCGGTLTRMAREGRSVHILLLADGETSRIDPSHTIDSSVLVARNTAAAAACRIMGCATLDILGLPDNRMDTLDRLDVVKHVEQFVNRYRPSTVFTHHAGDVNIDHRVTHDAVIAACRPQPGHPVRELLFFEVPSSTEWRPPASAEMFSPNVFIDISESLAAKIEALETYIEELRQFPHPRSVKAVEVLAEWRGATVGVPAAEAFVLGRKLVSS